MILINGGLQKLKNLYVMNVWHFVVINVPNLSFVVMYILLVCAQIHVKNVDIDAMMKNVIVNQ